MSDSSVAEEFIGPEKPAQHAAPHGVYEVAEGGVKEIHIADGFGLRRHTKLQRWANRLESLAGAESRGIERVPEELRAREAVFADYIQVFLIWFSANITLNNLTIGLLGPASFYVGSTECMIIGTFGTILGSALTGYISTFGPLSGNRTLVTARFAFGLWPSRLLVLLNIVIMLGYGLIDCILSGMVLSAVSGGGMTVIVGIIISAIIALVIALFGIKLFHIYERYAFIPQVCVLFVLVGVAGAKFNSGSTSSGTSQEIIADRMSYFFLCVSAPLAWCGSSCDFFVYFPPTASRFKIFCCTTSGLALSTIFTLLLGVGLASGALVDTAWAAASDVSAGALVTEAFAPLGGFGSFCAVILALGLIGNNVPGTYSAAIGFQMLGSWFMKVPRTVWTIILVVIYTVAACAGRDSLYTIFSNFLALMGYWTIMFVTIMAEEEFIFRQRNGGYNWSLWDQPSKLPVGIAALVTFLIGWVGAVLGMYQIYFTGPLAKLVGDGIDLGIPIACSWSAIIYPGLRYLELKRFGR